MLALITVPTVDVLTLNDAKEHLRVDADDDNALISGLIGAVVGMLDPAAGGWLGRALRPQTWELRLYGFPCEEIALPYPPLISIVSVKYDDTAGVERTLAVTTGYRILNSGGLGKVLLAPPYNTAWPATRDDRETVRIRYTCGHAASPDALPAPIAAWLKLQLGKLYEQREAVIVGSDVRSLPEIDGLVWPYRVF